MSETRIWPQLVLRRDHLRDLPPVVLPDGYTLRTYREGDGAAWALILNESFGGERTESDFIATMVNDPAYRPERIFFICDPTGFPCATASAYRHRDWDQRSGFVHYVACRPAHLGKRLGYFASLAVLHKFQEEGCMNSLLFTDDFRIPAIKTYLRLGFHPLIIDDNQPERWRAIFTLLGLPDGMETLVWREERPTV